MILFKDKPDYKGAAVYYIYCEAEEKYYIGCTANFYERIHTHMSRLRLNKHYSKKLQDAYNNGKMFSFGIIKKFGNTREEHAKMLECEYENILKTNSAEYGYNNYCFVPYSIRCADIIEAELARRTGQTPQNMNNKYKRNTFKISELEKIAKALNAELKILFIDKETGEPII